MTEPMTDEELANIPGLKDLLFQLRVAQWREHMHPGRAGFAEMVQEVKIKIQNLVVPYGYSLTEVLND